jgi:hypothetical protein
MQNTKSIAVYLLFSFCLLTSSAQTSTELLHRAQRAITGVIVHDIFSPPVSSRIYLYSSLAAYEASTVDNKMNSFHRLRNDFQPPDRSLHKKNINRDFSAVYALLLTASKFVFSDSMLLDSMTVITKAFKHIKPDEYAASVAWATAVSSSVVRWSQSDQYAETRKMRRYSLIKNGSAWIPTPPGYFQAVEPHWGKIRTVALDSLHHFRPRQAIPFSTDKASAFFQQANEVYTTVKQLTRQDSVVALFWDCNPFHLTVQGHVNFATKKLSPGGHWMSIVGIVSQNANAGFSQSVKAYFFTSIALFDAFISCWDEKYRSNTIRPESYINAHIDETWRPLLQTPPFPEYTSGHSVISASAAVVLTSLFGSHFQFVDNTEIPYGLPSRPFSSFWEAAKEAGISRFYGGIHYKSAIDQGLIQGEKIGKKVVQQMAVLATR